MKLKPWQVIALPFGVLAILFFVMPYLTHQSNWAKWGIIPFVILAVIYVMAPQVNWWWYKRNPPTLDIRIQRFIDDHFIFYQKLTPELKERFRDRVALYLLGNEFIRPVHPDDPDATANRKMVPEDLKAAVASVAVQLSFGKQNFLNGKFENIIIYPHPFPTPQYGDVFHTSEIYEPDGVILFASDILMTGFKSPQDFFSIALYEFARIFRILNPLVSYPVLDEKAWDEFERISGISRPKIEAVINLTDIDIWGVAVFHFYTFPERFQKFMPDLYHFMSNIFNMNPKNEAYPVLNY